MGLFFIKTRKIRGSESRFKRFYLGGSILNTSKNKLEIRKIYKDSYETIMFNLKEEFIMMIIILGLIAILGLLILYYYIEAKGFEVVNVATLDDGYVYVECKNGETYLAVEGNNGNYIVIEKCL